MSKPSQGDTVKRTLTEHAQYNKIVELAQQVEHETGQKPKFLGCAPDRVDVMRKVTPPDIIVFPDSDCSANKISLWHRISEEDVQPVKYSVIP